MVSTQFLPLSCESISSSPAVCTFGGCEHCPLSSSHRLFLLLLSSKGLSVLALPLCPKHRLSESGPSKVQPLWLVGRAAVWKSQPSSSAGYWLCFPSSGVSIQSADVNKLCV